MRLLPILTPFKPQYVRGIRQALPLKLEHQNEDASSFSTVNSSCQLATNLSTVKTNIHANAELRQFYNQSKVHACNF